MQLPRRYAPPLHAEGEFSHRASQCTPVLHGLCHVGDLRELRAGQVGNCPGHFQSTVCRPSRPAKAGGGDVEELGGAVVQQHMGVDFYALQGVVGLFLTG